MSPSKIEVGKTYVNRGAGHGPHKANCKGIGKHIDDPHNRIAKVNVAYRQDGKEHTIDLPVFAQWAGKEC